MARAFRAVGVETNMTTFCDGSPSAAPSTARWIARVYDVESRGLRGAAWAVAWVDLWSDGTIEPGGCVWTTPANVAPRADISADPGADAWAAPAVAALVAADIEPTTPEGVLRALWGAWCEAKASGVPLFGDCLWPVDGAALAAAHDLAMREDWTAGPFDGPFPLWDITSIVGATSGPIPDLSPEEAHDPRNDARWSAERLWAHGWRGVAGAVEPVAPPKHRPLAPPPDLTPPDVTAWLADDPDGLLAPLPPPGNTELTHLARAGAVLRQWRPSTPEARRSLNQARLAGAPGPMHARVRAWLADVDINALAEIAAGEAWGLQDAIDGYDDNVAAMLGDVEALIADLCARREDLERIAWALGTVGAAGPLNDVLSGIDADLTTDARLAAADHSPLRGDLGAAIRRVQHEAWWVADETASSGLQSSTCRTPQEVRRC